MSMTTTFVRMQFDLYCQLAGNGNPEYRVYVNDELFTERTWRFSPTQYVQEILPINAPLGEYKITVENLKPTTGNFLIRNLTCLAGLAGLAGPADIIDSCSFRIN